MECAAYECTAVDNDGQPLILHRFPENKGLQSMWIKAMRMENWQPSQQSRLCSKHFTLDSYVKKTVSLRKYAVPTIFEKYPNDVEEVEHKIKVEVDDITIEEEQFIAPQPTTTVFPSDIAFLPTKTFAGEYENKVVILLKRELSITKRNLNRMTEVARRRLKKIKALQQQLRRKQAGNSYGKGSATVLSIFKDYFVEFKSN